MTEPRFINTACPGLSETLEPLLSQRGLSVLWHPPGIILSHEKTFKEKVIVSYGNKEQLQTLLANERLPTTTPILYLGEGDSLPEGIVKQNDNRLIDYLRLPVSEEIFLHRISFLQRVQKISLEHHSQKTILSQQLNLLSSRDGLTGLFNRRNLTNDLAQLMLDKQSQNQELSLLILNIDYFNSINKSNGLEFGDFILNEMAARLTVTVDSNATCYRFSGEDFVVILAGVDLEQAGKVAAKISGACSEKAYHHGNKSISITVSVGIASLKDHEPDNHNEFLCMAETALFMAKAEGRNRCQIYLPQKDSVGDPPQKSLVFLKDNLNRILEKTRISAISSLQLLAKNIAGSAHRKHVTCVSQYVSLLGNQLGLSEQHTRTFQNSITLYNSFRFVLHNDLMSKPGKLTNEERQVMEDLPFKLNELTEMFDYFSEERNVLLNHNERYDGTGYPSGLKGDEIPLGARIFNIVDSLAAMSSERPYRKQLSPTEIIEELVQEAGKQFDPYLVLQLFNVIETNKLFDIDSAFLKLKRDHLLETFPRLRQ